MFMPAVRVGMVVNGRRLQYMMVIVVVVVVVVILQRHYHMGVVLMPVARVHNLFPYYLHLHLEGSLSASNVNRSYKLQ